MKHFFTLIISILCSAAMMAQAPAQEITNSSFKGSAALTIGSKAITVSNQTLDITLNETQTDCVDFQLSKGSFKYSILTITMIPSKAEVVGVTKNGDTYSLDSNKSFKVVMDNGSAQSDATGAIYSSTIDIKNKKATFVMRLTNLSSTIQKVVGDHMDVTYTMSMDKFTPTAIEAIKAAGSQADGKFMKNGKLIVRKNGVEYNTNGQIVK